MQYRLSSIVTAAELCLGVVRERLSVYDSAMRPARIPVRDIS
jgi:hypothetical protein